MSDDLVERLRGNGMGICQKHTVCYCIEASDEIERLRAERDAWKELAEADAGEYPGKSSAWYMEKMQAINAARNNDAE